MSVSIGWRPVNPKQFDYVGGGSSFLKVLETAFGELPINLSDKHILKLSGIAACGYPGADELIEAIRKKEHIEVVARY